MRALIAIVLSLMANLASAEVPRDADLARLIIGTWQAAMDYPEAQIHGVGFTQYKADGTFASSGDVTIQGDRMRIGAEGVWSVTGTVLTWTVRKTINPDLMAVGETHTEEILEINAERIMYRGDEGEIEVERRVTNSSGD